MTPDSRSLHIEHTQHKLSDWLIRQPGFDHFFAAASTFRLRTAIYQGNRISAMSGRDLEDGLFEIIPEKVSAVSGIAHNVKQSSRAMYLWLSREFALKQSGEIVELPGDCPAMVLTPE